DNVVARNRRSDARFLDETFASTRVFDQRRKHQLERAAASGAELLGNVNRAHAAAGKRSFDAEVACKYLAGLKVHDPEPIARIHATEPVLSPHHERNYQDRLQSLLPRDSSDCRRALERASASSLRARLHQAPGRHAPTVS